VLPAHTLPDRSFPSALTVIDWRSGAVEQDYRFPDGVSVISNQFIPRISGEGGWVRAYLIFSRRRVEYWLFDAGQIAAGPLARLGCDDLAPVGVVHHHYTLEAPARRSSYRVSVEDDLGTDWRHLPEPFRQTVADGLRIAAAEGYG
jgi:hypothetical protein